MSPRRYYFWLACRDSNGKHYLVFGSDKSEDEARQKGFEMLGGAREGEVWLTKNLNYSL